MLTQEPEKENLEINLQRSDACPEQNKVRKDLVQTSLQKMTQFSTAKDPHGVSVTNPAKVMERFTPAPETKPDSFRGNSEVNTTFKTANKNVKTEIKSASSQTDESLYSYGAFKTCASTQTEEDLEDNKEPMNSPDSLEKPESGNKMLLSGSFPIPADPARLAERILRNRTQLSAAFDDTEYEPYGLPEVVMKGTFEYYFLWWNILNCHIRLIPDFWFEVNQLADLSLNAKYELDGQTTQNKVNRSEVLLLYMSQ